MGRGGCGPRPDSRTPPLSSAQLRAPAPQSGGSRLVTIASHTLGLPCVRSKSGGVMSIDPQQPIPLYYQLKTLLLEEVLDGRYGPGDRLPTEHELCERSGSAGRQSAARSTELAEEGVILRHRRRGTFVNPHWLRRRPDQAEVRIVVSEGPLGAADPRRRSRRHPGEPASPCRSRHCIRHSRTRWRTGRHLISPFSTRSGFPSSRSTASCTPSRTSMRQWVRREWMQDFLEPLVAANRYEGRTYGVSAARERRGSLVSPRRAGRARSRASDDLGSSCVRWLGRPRRTASPIRS